MDMQLRQSQQLRTFQLQYFSLLAMDRAALEAHLYNAYLENPFLEEASPAASQPQSDKSSKDPLMQVPAQPGINRYIPFLEQLDLRQYADREISLMCSMIDSLDCNGYYKLSIEETMRLFHASEEEVYRCLNTLRGLEPPGVFAHDLQHCLLMQLDRMHVLNDELRSLVLFHLEDLAGSDKTLSRKSGIPVARLRQYRRLLTQLNPRPFYKPDCRNNRYTPPDVICQWDGHEWLIQSAAQTQYIISPACTALLLATDGAQRQQLTSQATQAKALLRAVEMRTQTLLRLTAYVAKIQQAALLTGAPPRAIPMSEAARELEVSVSTISRACKEKYIQCPAGVIPLRSFFPAAANPGDCLTANQIKRRLHTIISAENPLHPLSDDELADALQTYGMSLSRRTVAKYRAALGIPSSYERRKSNEST